MGKLGQDSNKQVAYTCSEFALQEMRQSNGLNDQENECVCFTCRGELYLIEGKWEETTQTEGTGEE